jgi:hypothetical protein
MSIIRERAVASLTRVLSNARQRRSIVSVAIDQWIVSTPAVFEREPMPGMPESQLTQDLREYLQHAEATETTTGQQGTDSAKAS